MRAVINGIRYDTSSAVLIGLVPKADLQWWEEGLYKTPRAEQYFIAGAYKGGIGDFGIFPMERDKALEWAERYLTAEQVEAGFAVVMDAA
jgi:hypothetical protein